MNTEQQPAPSAIPADFPNVKTPASLAGVQMKLTARLIDGKFVTDFTDDELAARYATCQKLVEDLHPYSLGQQKKHPELSLDQLLQKVAEALEGKNWGLTPLEIEWIVGRLRLLMTPAPV